MSTSTNTNFSKRLRIFKNGDESFGGKQIVISQRATKSWDAFLAQVTNQLDSNVAVRSIHTPVNGTPVKSMDELSDKLDYVAVTTGTFKKINYSELKERKPLSFHKPKALTQAEELEISKNKMNVPGRIKDVQTGSISIFVYANGDATGQAQRVTIPWRCMDKWEVVINEVDNKMKIRNFDARSLYTLDGQLVTSTNQLDPGGQYVAVGVGTNRFIKAEYGTSVKPHFYVPLNRNATRNASWQPQPTEKWKKQSKTNLHQNKSGMSENNIHSGSSEGAMFSPGGSNKASSPQSDVTLKSNRSTKSQKPFHKSEGNLSNKNQQKVKQQQQQQQQQQKQHQQQQRQQRIVAKEIDYDNDEGGIFKAKHQRRETKFAQVIHDDSLTKVEVPVEMMNPDDVMEEIESGDNKHNGQHHGAHNGGQLTHHSNKGSEEHNGHVLTHSHEVRGGEGDDEDDEDIHGIKETYRVQDEIDDMEVTDNIVNDDEGNENA